MIVRHRPGSRCTVRRMPGLLRIQLPGFGGGRVGIALYLLVALLLGAPWRRRADAILAVQLPWPAAVAGLAGRLYRVPFMVFSTLTGELSDVDDLQVGRFSALRRALLGGAAWLVVQTPAGAQDAAGLLPRVAITVVPNPVRRSWAPLRAPARASFAGRLTEEKEVTTLLESWRTVADARPEARLVIAGDGDGGARSREAEVRAVIDDDPRLSATVSLLGWVGEIRAVLTSCDLFVFPSRIEGMSNALLEAMACGRVIVASDIAPNRAVVGDSYPYLFPVGDAAALAAVIQRAMVDDEARRIALAQLDARLDDFSPQRVGAMLEDLIGSVDRL
jgi:glycosyltransferase involved in cell wall biosynthesis